MVDRRPIAELTLKSLPRPFFYPTGDVGAAEAAGHIIDGDEYQLLPIRKAGHWVNYIVDVGGNCGAFGVQAARVFPGCKILTAEPIESLGCYYRANLARLCFTEKQPDDDGLLPGIEEYCYSSWPKVDPFAYGKAYGRVKLRYYKNGSTGSYVDGSWNPDYANHNCDLLDVEMVRLSDRLLYCSWPRIDVLKLDCEGSEVDVLEDLAENYGLWRVRWIRFEWHGLENLNRIIQVFLNSGTHTANWDCRPGQKLGFGLAHSRLDA